MKEQKRKLYWRAYAVPEGYSWASTAYPSRLGAFQAARRHGPGTYTLRVFSYITFPFPHWDAVSQETVRIGTSGPGGK